MQFHPPIPERSTQQLLAMAADEAGWVPEARALARMELERRGVATEVVQARETRVKAASLVNHLQREQNATESYSVWALIGIFLVAPFLLLVKLVGHKIFLHIELGLSKLDRDNYKKKYRQRMAALAGGVLCWVILLRWLNG